MSASEKLKALDETNQWSELERVLFSARHQITAVVEAYERRGDGVEMIRALGFVGNTHYCPDCLNEFHEDYGQHEPDCGSLASMREDEDWWEDRLHRHPSLAALKEALQ